MQYFVIIISHKYLISEMTVIITNLVLDTVVI